MMFDSERGAKVFVKLRNGERSEIYDFVQWKVQALGSLFIGR